ncbi:MAG: 50S ribosomal protein L23 [Clostridiales bacterium]|nr:50S ribosomal protein L23 [Clostridiales bacterium]
MFNEDIIIKPVLTEKSYDMMADKRYVFQVAPKATKTQIKTAVEEIFGVKVEKVNTVVTQGKLKRMGKYEGRTSTVKKAYVVLKKDSKAIEFFENMA